MRTPALRASLVVVVSAAVICGACATAAVFGLASPGIGGPLAVEAADGTSTAFRFTDCSSGDRYGFYGVDLTAADQDVALRVLLDPIEGPRGRFVASGPSARLDASACRVLHVRLGYTGWRINHVRDLGGEVELDCRLPGNERVRGTVAFTHCH